MTAILSIIAAMMLQPETAGLKARTTPVVSGEQTAAMKTIEKGLDSAVDDARQVVARTPAEWAKIWQMHSYERPRPNVDFTKEMVVGIFMGSRPTAGFGVEIVGTRQEDGTLVVQYRETKPDGGQMTAQILTSPYHLVSVPRVDGDVKFEPVN